MTSDKFRTIEPVLTGLAIVLILALISLAMRI